jgi:hypothetical protein
LTSSTTVGNTSSTAVGNATLSTTLHATSSAAGNAAVTKTAAFVHGYTSAAATGGAGAGAGAAGAGANPSSVEVAEFDKATGAPTNTAGKKELARVWKAGAAVDGKKTRMVQVP